MPERARVLRMVALDDLPDIGAKRGDRVYLARDGQSNRFVAVAYCYHLMRWVCSCGKGACEHKYAVNAFVVEQVQHERMTSDREELAAHLRDDGLIH